MQKGVVIEAGEKWAVVLTPDGQFCKVPANPAYMEGMEVTFSIPVPVSPFPTKRLMSQRWVRSVSAIAACLLLLVLIFPFFSGNQAYAAVTIDINPSLELDVDQKANVIEIHPLNDDGKKVMDQVQWKNQKLDVVALEIIKAAETSGLMNNQNQVIISTTFYQTQPENKGTEWDSMLEGVSTKVDQDVTVILVDGNKKWFEEAKKQSVSPGSYMLAKQAEQQGINLQLDDIQKGQWNNLQDVHGVKVIHSKKDHPNNSKSEPPGQEDKDTHPVNGKADVNSINAGEPSSSKANGKENGQSPSYRSDQGTQEQKHDYQEQKRQNHENEKGKKKVENKVEDDESSSNHGQDKKSDHGYNKDRQDVGKNKNERD